MTSRSPSAVRYAVEAAVYDPTTAAEIPLNVRNIVPSMDMDRVPFCMATVTVTDVDDYTWSVLNPQVVRSTSRVGRLSFQLEQQALTGVRLGSVPDVDYTTTAAVMQLRTVSRDFISGDVEIRVAGSESMMDDKRRNSGTTLNTGATTVQSLVSYSLNDVIGAGAYSLSADATVAGTAIPAGDRRLMLPGESHSDLIEPELAAINSRLYDYWGFFFFAGSRDTPPNYKDSTEPILIRLAAYTDAEGYLPADVDPCVLSVTETVTRDGDWADGILVKGDYEDGAGTRVIWYQASGGGANTKGRVVPQNRAQPSANIAEQMVRRSRLRGREFTVTARNRFDVVPGASLQVFLIGGTVLSAIVRAVEWDIESGVMTIRALTGTPI